jgi:hypothetical protein
MSTRIYHPFWKWEDYQNGFYDNCSGELKKEYINKIIEMFNSEKLTIENMNFVVDNWKFSCEHNLTNPSINQIAYIGQSACCVYCSAPSTVTMECWSMLTKEVQDRANKNAIDALKRFNNNNKIIQLCLNLD